MNFEPDEKPYPVTRGECVPSGGTMLGNTPPQVTGDSDIEHPFSGTGEQVYEEVATARHWASLYPWNQLGLK